MFNNTIIVNFIHGINYSLFHLRLIMDTINISEEPLMRAGALSTNHEIGDKIE